MVAGRPALAPEVKERSGAYKKNPQRQNKDVPRANGNRPPTPKTLLAPERKIWDQMCTDLESMGVMSSELIELLTAYCIGRAAWDRLRKEVKKEGITILNDKGMPILNPKQREVHKYREQLNKLLPEFGLTPSSRGKLVSMKAPPVSAMSELLSRRMGSN